MGGEVGEEGLLGHQLDHPAENRGEQQIEWVWLGLGELVQRGMLVADDFVGSGCDSRGLEDEEELLNTYQGHEQVVGRGEAAGMAWDERRPEAGLPARCIVSATVQFHSDSSGARAFSGITEGTECVWNVDRTSPRGIWSGRS